MKKKTSSLYARDRSQIDYFLKECSSLVVAMANLVATRCVRDPPDKEYKKQLPANFLFLRITRQFTTRLQKTFNRRLKNNAWINGCENPILTQKYETLEVVSGNPASEHLYKMLRGELFTIENFDDDDDVGSAAEPLVQLFLGQLSPANDFFHRGNPYEAHEIAFDAWANWFTSASPIKCAMHPN